MVSSYINNKGPVYDKYTPAPAKTTQSTKAATTKPATTVAGVMKSQGATAGEANRFANLPGAPSMAQMIKDTGATAGEAQRFANIAAAAQPKPPTVTKPPTVGTPATPPVAFVPPPTAEPQPVFATPSTPRPPKPPAPPPIKSAPIDTVEFNDDLVSEEEMLKLLFEDIGGQEILFLSRHDTVNGQTVLYQPIKNLDILQDQYRPDNLLKLEGTSSNIFDDFNIDLSDRIPVVGNGENGLNYYIDETDGSLIIEFINLETDEEVDIQITSSGTIEDIGA